MREIFTINDGYGPQCFSTWDAARKYLFVLRGRFAGEPEDCGYQGALSFDTRNGEYEHGTPATAHRVKQVVSAGYQCTLRDSNDPHSTYITVTPCQMFTAKDIDAQYRADQLLLRRREEAGEV